MKNIVLVFLLLLMFNTQAQTDNDAVLFERKTQLEQMITERIRAKIATTLDKELFEVSVEVNLVKILSKNPLIETTTIEKDPKEQVLPNFSIDLIESKKVIDQYQKELSQLKEAIKQNSQVKQADSSNFQIKSIRVLVGISSTLPGEFLTQMNQWLSKQLKSEFGNLATGTVSKMTPKPEVKLEPKSATHPKEAIEHLKDFQYLIGFVLIFTAVILSVVLSKMIISKETYEIHKLKAQVAATPVAGSSQPQESPQNDKKSNVPQAAESEFNSASYKKYDELVIKISSLCNPQQDQFIIEAWLENGVEGAIKLTLYVDTLLTPAVSKKIEGADSIFQKIKIPANSFVSVEEAMKIVKNYSPDLKLTKLEEVYWDLLSVKTLGLQSVKKPFAYLNKMPSGDLQKFLFSQDAKVRGMVLLTASSTVRTEVFSSLDMQQKKNFLLDTLSLKDVSYREIQTINELFKTQLSMRADTDQRISTWEVFPKLISDMSVVDEILILNEINLKLPESIASIKKQTPLLAFMNEWDSRYLERLLSISSNEEIKALLRLKPDWTNSILSKCPDLVKTIVMDDLKQTDQMTMSDKEIYLKSMKQKLLDMIKNSEVNLNTIYKSVEEKSAA